MILFIAALICVTVSWASFSVGFNQGFNEGCDLGVQIRSPSDRQEAHDIGYVKGYVEGHDAGYLETVLEADAR